MSNFRPLGTKNLTREQPDHMGLMGDYCSVACVLLFAIVCQIHDANAAEAAICPRGFESYSFLNSTIPCKRCSAGYFKNTTSNNTCAAHTKCGPGKYTSVSGTAKSQPKCESCDIGRYKFSTSITSSSSCATNKTAYYGGVWWTQLKDKDCSSTFKIGYDTMEEAQDVCIRMGASCAGILENNCGDRYFYYYTYYMDTDFKGRYQLCKVGTFIPATRHPWPRTEEKVCVHERSKVCANDLCSFNNKCPPGKYTKRAGSAVRPSYCAPCPTGFFKASTSTRYTKTDYCANMAREISCPPGKHIYAPGTTQPTCETCSKGFFKDRISANSTRTDYCTAHTKCPPGQYRAVKGTATTQTQCKACAHGFYKASRSRLCFTWTQLKKRYCASTFPGTYSTLESAQDACISLGRRCAGVYDETCHHRHRWLKGDYYYLCKHGTGYKEARESCIHTLEPPKGNETTSPISFCPRDYCSMHFQCPPGKYTRTAGTDTRRIRCDTCALGFYKATKSLRINETDSCTAARRIASCPAGQYVHNTILEDSRCESCKSVVGMLEYFASRSRSTTKAKCPAPTWLVDVGPDMECDRGAGEVYMPKSSMKRLNLDICKKTCKNTPGCKSITYSYERWCSHFSTMCWNTKRTRRAVSMRFKTFKGSDCKVRSINIGKSPAARLKRVFIHDVHMCTNKPANYQKPGWKDRFLVRVSKSIVVVRRMDAASGWTQPLRFYCLLCREKRTTTTHPPTIPRTTTTTRTATKAKILAPLKKPGREIVTTTTTTTTTVPVANVADPVDTSKVLVLTVATIIIGIMLD